MTENLRRQQFADRLREIREAAGLTGALLAQRAGWQPSKVTKIQNGKQAPSEQDIRTWSELAGVSPEPLLTEWAQIRADEARWSRQLRSGHRAVQEAKAGLESSAQSIRCFDSVLVPGLLQTAAYARRVFELHAELHSLPTDIDAAVAARMERQTVLYDSNKNVELLIYESALRNPIASADDMAVQVDRIRALLGTVRIGVVPLGAQLVTLPLHGVWMYDNLVEVEILHTTISTSDPADVEIYNRWLDSLWATAIEGPQLGRVLDAISA